MANDKDHLTDNKNGRQTDVQPSETENQTGDPGRTPGKAEGEDDASATDSGQKQQDTENYEKTKEKKLAESVTPSDRNTF